MICPLIMLAVCSRSRSRGVFYVHGRSGGAVIRILVQAVGLRSRLCGRDDRRNGLSCRPFDQAVG